MSCLPEEAACSKCLLYIKHGEYGGECRRYPKYQGVRHDHWCGEFVDAAFERQRREGYRKTVEAMRRP